MKKAIVDSGYTMDTLGKASDADMPVVPVVFRHGVGRIIPRPVKEATQISTLTVRVDSVTMILVQHHRRKLRKGLRQIKLHTIIRIRYLFYKRKKGFLRFPGLKGFQTQGNPRDSQLQHMAGFRI
jgi:hypothetical protein